MLVVYVNDDQGAGEIERLAEPLPEPLHISCRCTVHRPKAQTSRAATEYDLDASFWRRLAKVIAK